MRRLLPLLLTACQASAPPDLTLLVAMDGLRADHTALCGAPRGSTPTLLRLRDELRAATSCEARATSPKAGVALASVLTGELPWEHRYDPRFASEDWASRATLAERLAEQGWRTVLVNAHPWVDVADGYERVVSAETWVDLRGEDLVAAVREQVQGARRRTLLTVVSVDADPLQGDLPLLDGETVGSDAWTFSRGGGTPGWRLDLLQRVKERQERATREADTVLGELLKAVAEARGTTRGVRLAVVGLRGNLLGEGGQLGDAGWVWDGAVRVPLVLLDTTRATPFPPLPDTPLSAASVSAWLRDGALPRPPIPPAAFSLHERGRAAPGDDQVVIWGPEGVELLSWRGLQMRFLPQEDAATDPPHMPHDSGMLPSLVEQERAWHEHLVWREQQMARRGLAPTAPPPEEIP